MLLNINTKTRYGERCRTEQLQSFGLDERALQDIFFRSLDRLFPGDELILFMQSGNWQEKADLMAVDKEGNLFIFELKAWESHRSNLLQVLNYVQIFGAMRYPELDALFKKATTPCQSLKVAHKAKFGIELADEDFNRKQVFVVMINGFDFRTREAARYWRSSGLDVRPWVYQVYVGGADEMFLEISPLRVLDNSYEDITEGDCNLNANVSNAQQDHDYMLIHGKAVQAAVGTKSRSSYEKTRLISGFTFDNLIGGKANNLARAVSTQVAINPGRAAYNPLFIYGGAGLGKTHLIHAIGNHILDQNPDKLVRYVHAEDYYSDVVRAYQQKSFDVFKRYYRSLDVLLLDDVQFFKSKNRTQEEFFYVLNALIVAKKQIVVSCDTYPKDISGLKDRIITRFDRGVTVQIEPPEIEMRAAILKKKAETEGVTLDGEVAFYIAKHLRSNVCELEGALKKLLAFSSFHGRQITLELAKEALSLKKLSSP